MKRAAVLLASLVGLAPGAAACGQAATERPVPRAEHNATDTHFAASLVTRDGQVRALAELAATRARAPQVRGLASDIVSRSAPEIDILAGWLGEWEEAAAATHRTGGPGADLQRLRALSGGRFDTGFLAAMMTHHERTIRLAETELRHGEYEPAKALAERIGRAQSAEIIRIRELQRHLR